MEQDLVYCKRHPRVQTALRCSKCDDAICPKCAVLTTVGYRCRRCGLEADASVATSAARISVGAVVGVALSTVAGSLVSGSLTPFMGFFAIFVGAVAGGLIGEIVRRCLQLKHSKLAAATTSLGFMIGSMYEPLRVAMVLAQQGEPASATMRVAFGDIWALAFGLSAAFVSWVRIA